MRSFLASMKKLLHKLENKIVLNIAVVGLWIWRQHAFEVYENYVDSNINNRKIRFVLQTFFLFNLYSIELRTYHATLSIVNTNAWRLFMRTIHFSKQLMDKSVKQDYVIFVCLILLLVHSIASY